MFIQGTVSFINLVVAFTRMIDSIPHDQNFTQLVINQIITYYEKCFGWYKGLCAIDGTLVRADFF